MTLLTVPWELMLLGQAAGQPVDAAAGESFWDFAIKGGPMMIPIGVCSLVALAVILERLLTLRSRNVIPPSFLSSLKGVLGDGAGDRSDAVEHCKKNGSPIANVLAAGIKKLGEPIEVLEKHIQEAGEREALKLRKYLRLLSVVASIAPLMGLLGTIFGMINAFQTVATSGEALGKAELLAEGIYEAMITTAAGLMLAIPVLIAYHWVSGKIEGLVSEMDHMTLGFIEEYGDLARGEGDVLAKFRSGDENNTDDEADDGVAAMASA